MEKIVKFDEYCAKCKYFKKKETDDPCDECLTYPVNEDSQKPILFEARDDG